MYVVISKLKIFQKQKLDKIFQKVCKHRNNHQQHKSSLQHRTRTPCGRLLLSRMVFNPISSLGTIKALSQMAILSYSLTIEPCFSPLLQSNLQLEGVQNLSNTDIFFLYLQLRVFPLVIHHYSLPYVLVSLMYRPIFRVVLLTIYATQNFSSSPKFMVQKLFLRALQYSNSTRASILQVTVL